MTEMTTFDALKCLSSKEITDYIWDLVKLAKSVKGNASNLVIRIHPELVKIITMDLNTILPQEERCPDRMFGCDVIEYSAVNGVEIRFIYDD